MPKDLSVFLKEYEAQYPEDIVHIEREVNSNQEVSALQYYFAKQEKYPIIFCHKVINADGKVAKQPLVTNMLASRTRRARICNSTFSTLGRDVYEATRARRKKPVVISKSEAPVREVVKTGNSINLLEFPALKHNAMDAGYYFSAGFFTTYAPDSGIDNCALIRGWIKEKDTVRCAMAPRPGHSMQNLYKHELKNQNMRVAYWQGHHPVAYIGALTKLPYPGSHWEAIGGMLGEPLRLVASESLGDDFLLPADAELIVEGIMEAHNRYPEGPFGEFPGYFGGQVPSPQFKVTAITHRKDAIWYDIAAGTADHQGTGASSLEGRLWENLKSYFPSLQNVYMPLSGVGRFHAYLQFKNPGPAEVRQAMLMALSCQPAFIKHVFAFDDDVDIFDEREVMWAIATRSQWDKDVVTVPRASSGGLDPSSGIAGTSCKGGIDCTKPLGEHFEEKVYVEGEVLQRVKLEEYLAPDTIDKVKMDRAV